MRKALTLLVAAVLVSGCALVYRQPVFQGTLVQKENVQQLKAGMNRQQVFALIGSPPVADVFNQDRWDYVATQRRGRGEMEVKTLTLWFENDALARWEGEYFPKQDEALALEMRKFGNLPKDDKSKRSGR